MRNFGLDIALEIDIESIRGGCKVSRASAIYK